MIKRISLVLIYISSLASYAQDFERNIIKANEAYRNHKFVESTRLYENAFRDREGTSEHYYNAACSYALTGDTVMSMEYLHTAAEKGWRNLDHLLNDVDLNGLHGVQGWDSVLSIVYANSEAHNQGLDMELKEQLESIYIKDQTLRKLMGEAMQKFGKGSREMVYLWELISYQDSINEAEVTCIIDKRGWAGRSLVGNRANLVLWVVLQHAPMDTQEKYLPLLKKSVRQGESDGAHLALLEDRILMRKGMPQIYGSQIVTDSESGRQKIYRLEDPQFVDRRREKVGLGPLAEYVKRWGIEFDIPQEER